MRIIQTLVSSSSIILSISSLRALPIYEHEPPRVPLIARSLTCVLLIGLMQIVPAEAQSEQSFNQSFDYVYGDRLAFRVEVDPAQPVAEARLIVNSSSGETVYAESVTVLPASSIITAIVAAKAIGLSAFARMTYHWEIKYQTGAVSITPATEALYQDTSVPWQWTETRRGGIIAHTDGRDPSLANATLDFTSAALARVTQTLGGQTYPNDLHVYVYPELASLAASLRLHGQKVQDWVAARAFPDQGIIVVAYSTEADSLTTLERDIAHEVTHLAVYAASNGRATNIPGWLDEGIALNNAAKGDTALHDSLNEGIRKGVLLSLDVLCAPDFTALPPHDAALAYAQSESLVRYVNERYGISQVRALVDSYRDGRSCNDGVEVALGIPLAQLEAQWHESLGQNMPTDTTETGSAIPWVLAWIVSLGVAYAFVKPSQQLETLRSDYETRIGVAEVE